MYGIRSLVSSVNENVENFLLNLIIEGLKKYN